MGERERGREGERERSGRGRERERERWRGRGVGEGERGRGRDGEGEEWEREREGEGERERGRGSRSGRERERERWRGRGVGEGERGRERGEVQQSVRVVTSPYSLLNPCLLMKLRSFFTPFIIHECRHTHYVYIVQSPNSSPPEPPASPTASVEKVELVKPPHGGLGLLIQESPDQAGVFIQEVVENQAAFLDGRIKSGDKILAINHNSTVGASQDTVFKLLQGCQGKVVLTVQHRDAFSPAPSSIEFSETDSNFPQPPAVKYPFREAQVQIPNRDPPPYPSPFSSYLPDPQKGVHSAMWGPMQERVTQHSPPPPPVHCSREGK